MLRIISACIAALCMCDSAAAYKLLEVPGRSGTYLKWGEARVGTRAVIRFSLARNRYHLEDGIKGAGCDTIEPLDRALEKSGLTESEFLRETKRGLGWWSEVADITLVYVSEAKDADVLIGAQAYPSGRAFANVHIRPGSKTMYTIEKGIVCLNPHVRFTSGSSDGKATLNIAYVISHEFGHVIGLDHPKRKEKTTKRSLMAFIYSESHVMSEDEEEGAQFLYGPALK